MHRVIISIVGFFAFYRSTFAYSAFLVCVLLITLPFRVDFDLPHDFWMKYEVAQFFHPLW